MRPKSIAVALCLFVCSFAAADTIESVSPQSFYVGAVEEFLTINGTNLKGNVTTLVRFSGPAGTFLMEPSVAEPTYVITYLPFQILSLAGQYAVEVLATDDTGTRTIGGGTFVVQELPNTMPPLIGVPEVVVAEATSRAGAVVSYSVRAFSFVTASPAIVCTQPPGTLFPLGTTRVTCTVIDSNGTTSDSFLIVVGDTTPPVLQLPADIVTSESIVTYSVTATDNISTTVEVSCDPASGSTFPFIETTVACVATDEHLNVVRGSFTVTVTDLAPMLTLPQTITAEATGPTGATVHYVVTATNDGAIACTRAAGSLFPLGTTTVACTATNAHGSRSGAFNVVVRDTTSPAMNVPASFSVVTGTPGGAVVTYSASANDLVDGAIVPSCTPASGTTFPLGPTVVQCTATDSRNNISFATFTVTVINQPPPTLNLPAGITREAAGPNGAVVTYTVTASAGATVSCTPASGSMFPIATTTVNCAATDNLNQTTTGSFTVTVRDTTPPTLTLPANITAEATSPSGAAVTYTASATDIVDGNVAVNCTAPSGSTFAIGTTTVHCTATDARGNPSSGSFTVKVQDTTAPQIVSLTSDVTTIWPPDHKMVPVTLTTVRFDAVGPVATKIISISSNQAPDGIGDGHTSEDWSITGAMTAQVRAERVGNAERTYTLTVEATDAYGNTSRGSVEIVVPRVRPR